MDPMQYVGIGGLGWPTLTAGFLLFFVWGLFWKGFALWYAAKRHDTVWFIALLIVNTLGVLEIIYILFVAKVPEFRKKLGL